MIVNIYSNVSSLLPLVRLVNKFFISTTIFIKEYSLKRMPAQSNMSSATIPSQPCWTFCILLRF